MKETTLMRSLPWNANKLLIFNTQDAENQRPPNKWRCRPNCQLNF
jgi:hypothetical protein